MNELLNRELSVDRLEPGDHLCCIYKTEAEHRELVTGYMISGLRRNEKVVYIVDTRTAETVLGYLRDAGEDVEPLLESGQLVMLSVDEAYMRGGVFDPDGMIGMLREEMEKALFEGYAALRLTGEMSWALRGLPGSERLIEYEAKLNEFFPGSRCLAICQYDARIFDASTLLGVLSTHPMAVIGTEIFENHYYMPPGEMLSEDPTPAILAHWMEHLRERRRIEQSLWREREKARNYLDIAGVIIVALDRWGRVELINRAGLEMLGYDEDELLGRDWFETCLPEGIRAEVRGVFDSIMSGEIEPYSRYERPVVTRSGDVRIINWHNSVLTDGQGAVTGTLNSGGDITDLKRAEADLQVALDESEKRKVEIEALLEGAQSVLEHREFADSARSIFESCRRSVGAMSGYVALLSGDGTENELLFLESGGLPCTVDPSLPMPIRGLRAEAYRTGQAVFDNEFPASGHAGLLPDGHVRLENVLFAPLVLERRAVGLIGLANKGGGFTGEDARLARAFADIAAVALSNSRNLERLREANAELDLYAHTVSHDLKGPISAIGSAAVLIPEVLKARPIGEEEYADVVNLTGILERNVSRANDLIDGLLATAEAGHRPGPVQYVDVNAVVADVLDERSGAIKERGILVRVGEGLGTVAANQTHVYQVFSNLIGNAIRYCGAVNPVIEIARMEDDGRGMARYMVRDNGPGIDEEQAEDLFMPFFKGAEGHHGIGLSIVEKLVRLYGGGVKAYNDGGACFEFTLRGA